MAPAHVCLNQPELSSIVYFTVQTRVGDLMQMSII